MYTTLVTGASKGIGLEIAKRLAADGHKVIGIARSKLEQPFPGDYHRIDLEDAEKATQALDDLLRTSPIDNLVNNAGYPIP